MNTLTPFQYGAHEVRTLSIDDEPWFVLADLCKVLGLSQPHRVAARIPEDARTSNTIIDSMGRPQLVTIVSESGMYEVVIRSDKPHASTFRRWITSEVLPSIRKTGSYGTPQLTEDQIVRQALAITHRDLEAAKDHIAALEPRAAYVDTYVADDDLRILRNVAKSLDIPEGVLRDALIAHHWIYREESSRWSEKRQEKVTQYRYSPYAAYRQYFRPVPNHEAPRFKGEVDHTLKVTPQGAVAIERAARRWGLITTTDMEPAA